MRQSLAGISNCPAALSVALLAVVMAPSSPDVALSDASGSGALTSTAPPAPACGSNELALHEPSPDSEPGCATAPRTPEETAEARAYLIETASPGYTMTLQGAELAIGRLHPEFAVRLENAIREARSAGLPSAGIFSAYRPPAFGVGGFSDKFNSLHTYGLAVDMRGIGNPGSPKHSCGTRSLPRTASFVPMVLATTPNGIIVSRPASRSSRPRTPCARR
jgi:hypothetical protein